MYYLCNVNLKDSNMTDMELQQINEEFNLHLHLQIEGKLPAGYVYRFGNPSTILKAVDIPDLPIEMASRRLVNKAMQDNHPFELAELKDLPLSLHNPLAIFRSATRIGSNVIMTDLTHNSKNFVVAVETCRSQGKNLINSIRSVHYRNSDMNIINWIVDGLCDYIRTDFRESWFSSIENELQSKPQYNSVDVRKQLISAAKIIENFELAKDSEEKIV